MIVHNINDKASFQGIAHRPRFSRAPHGPETQKHLDPKEVDGPTLSSHAAPEGFSPPLPNGAVPFLAFDGYLTWEVPFSSVGMVEIPLDIEEEAAEFLEREAWNKECAA